MRSVCERWKGKTPTRERHVREIFRCLSLYLLQGDLAVRSKNKCTVASSAPQVSEMEVLKITEEREGSPTASSQRPELYTRLETPHCARSHKAPNLHTIIAGPFLQEKNLPGCHLGSGNDREATSKPHSKCNTIGLKTSAGPLVTTSLLWYSIAASLSSPCIIAQT
ncbi:hypothetical protein B566_EDAN016289, partial [Ephemera danica]